MVAVHDKSLKKLVGLAFGFQHADLGLVGMISLGSAFGRVSTVFAMIVADIHLPPSPFPPPIISSWS